MRSRHLKPNEQIDWKLSTEVFSIVWRQRLLDDGRWTVNEQSCRYIGTAETLLAYLQGQGFEPVVRQFDKHGKRIA